MCTCRRCRAVVGWRPHGLGVLPVVAGLVLFAEVLRPAALHAQGYIDLSVRMSTMNENGGTLEYRVALLNVQPTSDVTITITSGDVTVATADPDTLTFTSSNYRTEQVVTVSAVDDKVRNNPWRQTAITFTASGGGYDGVSRTHWILLADDEDIHFTVVEGLSYALRPYGVVSAGCPMTVKYESSDPSVLTFDPPALTWNERDSGTYKSTTIRVLDNDDLGDRTVRVMITQHQPPCTTLDLSDYVITVKDNDTGKLTVDATPPCGATVTDLSVTPSMALVLDPATSVELAVDQSVVSDNLWVYRTEEALSIQPGGRSIPYSPATFAELRQTYTNFAGYRYRLKDHPDVTARCTWKFKDQTPSVRLSASPNPVDEGSSVTVQARLSETLSNDVTIPLTLTAGTAEENDYGSLPSIAISAGSTVGTGTISTNEDADTDDETFTVALGALPSSVTSGSPSSVEVRIRDDDGGGGDPPETPTPTPTVRLSASPNPVDEGSSVTVTARLSGVLPADVTIPLTLTAVTAEEGDYGSLSAIAINAGSTLGTGTISTYEDTDTDDETFTVALGALPSSVTSGSPSSVEVRIRDDDGGGGDPPETPTPTPTVRLSASPNPVDEGSSVTVTARLSGVLPADVTIPLTLTAVTAEEGDYGSLSAIAINAGSTLGTGTISTYEDTDTDDETFTVALGALPSSVEADKPTSVEVTIRDNTQANQPPAFEQSAYTFNLRENEDGRHRPVRLGSVVATDPDGDEVAYALVSGDGQRFAVGTRSGRLTYTGAGEDYEVEPNRYALKLRARDQHGAEATANVNVDVTDVNEAPTVRVECDLCEVRPGGEVRLIAMTTDPDGDPVTCSWKAAEGRFMGSVLEAEARWRAPDDAGRVAIRVEATDGRGGSASAEMPVEVMNEEPVFEQPSYVFELRENEDGRQRPVPLGSAVAIDPDSDLLTYALVSGDVRQFAASARNGALTYTGAGEDFEAEPNRYALTMKVRDPYGEEATAEVTIEVTNQNEAPMVLAAIPDQRLEEGGAAAKLGLETYFSDPDGDVLSYSAVSSDLAMVTVAAAGSALTLAPAAYGLATIEVTARDPGGLLAKQTFAVSVGDLLVRAVIHEMLAAIARAHLASARMTLGRHVGPSGYEDRSRLRVMGITIPLDKETAREAAGRLLYDAAGHGGLRGGAGSTEFMFVWGGGDGGGASSRRNWRLWGQGDIQMFEYEPAPRRGYVGDLRSGWVGLDRAIGDHWLTGVAVAMSNSGSDWRAGTAEGRLWTQMTAVYPYLRYGNGATSVWTMAGGGRGLAENVRSSGRVGESDLILGLGHIEVRRSLAGWFGLRADAGYARLETEQGAETVDGRSAVVDQQRMGIELSPSSRHLGLSLDASARRDGGDGQTGTGLELAGGVRAGGGPVRIDALGRVLVLHSVRDYSERGLGVTLTIGSPSEEGGYLFSVTSRWGGHAAAAGTLWQTRVYGLQPDASTAHWSVGTSIRYVFGPGLD